MDPTAPSQTPASRPPRAALTFILITLALDAMGIGLILPVMPDLIQETSGGSLADAALWGGVLAFSFAAMQFLFAPFLGNLSDRFGRRPILLISLAVMAADYLVMALTQSIWVLLAARIVGGMAAAQQATANAFIADISTPEQKAARFGLVGAAFGVGFILGPLLGGLLGELGTRAPFYAAAILAAANLVLGAIVLPETVTRETRRPFELRRANPLGALAHTGRLPSIRRFLIVFFLYEFAFVVYPATWAYFTQARFGWEPATIGLSLALFGIAIGVVQGGLIRLILRHLGERLTVLYGLSFNFCAFLAISQVTSGNVALALIPLTALGAVVTPALQSMMSSAAPADAQGELQGLVSSARSVAMMVSPLVMTSVFFAFTREGAAIWFPGAPFLLSMGLMVVCGAVYVASPRATAAPAE
ncbi:MAG: MFS transporter [Pseudomonadota bacterium]